MIDKFRGAFLERESELLQKEKSSVLFCPVFLRKENCNFHLNLACIFFHEFSLYFFFGMRAEFGEVLSIGKHCGARLSS